MKTTFNYRYNHKRKPYGEISLSYDECNRTFNMGLDYNEHYLLHDIIYPQRTYLQYKVNF